MERRGLIKDVMRRLQTTSTRAKKEMDSSDHLCCDWLSVSAFWEAGTTKESFAFVCALRNRAFH